MDLSLSIEQVIIQVMGPAIGQVIGKAMSSKVRSHIALMIKPLLYELGH
jgi:hypothetical protein